MQRNPSIIAAIAVSALLALVGCGKPSDELVQDELPYSGPGSADFHAELNLANLLRAYPQGQPAVTPWAGYWWPYSHDGIATREYAAPPTSIWDRLFGHAKSATEKYDSAHGGRTRSDAWEKKNHGGAVPDAQSWWGHCNGWSAAAALFHEPAASVSAGGERFDVQDVKALLTEAAMEIDADFYGTRVESQADYDTPKYDDVAPDQLVLALTNFMGKLRQPLIVDRYTGDQVWNQPLAGYRIEPPKPSDYLGADPSAPDVYRLQLTATIWWVRDDVTPDTITPPFSFDDTDIYESRALKMEVWLDAPAAFDSSGALVASGNVVLTRDGDYVLGGAWRMGSGKMTDVWPDYVWIPYSLAPSTGYSNPELDAGWLKANLLQ